MNIRLKISAALAATAMALAVQPATAQVQGIAAADTSIAIAGSKARAAAYSQINATYTNYLAQIKTKNGELNSLNAKLDTNNDKVLDQAELDAAIKKKNPVIGQIEAKQKEITALRDPIIKAQMFAVGEIAKKYGEAQNNVIRAKKISMILSPEVFLYALPNVDVTRDITAQLDVLAPAVGSTPPANWQPTRQLAGIYQQVQQVLGAAIRQQAAQARAAQQPAAAAAPASR